MLFPNDVKSNVLNCYQFGKRCISIQWRSKHEVSHITSGLTGTAVNFLSVSISERFSNSPISTIDSDEIRNTFIHYDALFQYL